MKGIRQCQGNQTKIQAQKEMTTKNKSVVYNSPLSCNNLNSISTPLRVKEQQSTIFLLTN